ncbi:MAG TPA: low molecular weight protein-tyrosine-phosphatase [Spirochaetia bacterium]|nr:low molecular weight protein-tyrosine-phosphatase [Spirochaetia bacterium]
MPGRSSAANPPKRIMFVCSGNICRSPLAHAVFQDLVDRAGVSDRYIIESSGTSAYHAGDQADPRMRQTAHRHGVALDHRARQLMQQDLEEYDMILVMDRSNYTSVRSLTAFQSLASGKRYLEKVRMFRDFDPAVTSGGGAAEVPDPYYGDMGDFEQVFEIVMRTSRNLLAELEGGNAASNVHENG